MKWKKTLLIGLALACGSLNIASAQVNSAAANSGDIPANFTQPHDNFDYERREVMIPMRDGIRLHTVIIVPRRMRGLPILLTRTPYDASARASRANSPHMLATLPLGDELFVQDGYIRVFQDIRGKYGSEGDYVVTRPVRGPLNPTGTDHTTDAWDTIDWLVHNLPESNGRVGMIGSSYEGFTVAMALLNPHPALRVAAPESPMIDGWMGDDWFHFGAFRLANNEWIGTQTGYKGHSETLVSGPYDDYDAYRRAGSAGAWAHQSGFDALPFWQRLSQHPAYDAFWQGQALDRLLAAHPADVPTMWIQGLWDQEDIYGAVMTWEALKAAGHEQNNWLVMGPWRHSQVNRGGASLGPLRWDGDTALQFRRDVLLPFFNHYLKDRPSADPPRALIYNTGENHWDRLSQWPLACARGCPAQLTPLYLEPDFGLGFQHPTGDGSDSYVSDPAKPVPYMVRPIRFADAERWQQWLVSDQRPFSDRTDVLVYETEELSDPVRISGAPIVDLHAITTGTDADWVVKLIDVYPEEFASDPPMGGYQLPISLDIFRGRYRISFEHPSPIPAGRPQNYRFRLPTANHVFQPGHRIMVQIQSSLFPIYDRNPQTFVPNIFFARPQDYRPATQTVLHGSAAASAILLPIVR
jgi:putative CocE/NonD family hydrolase